MLMIKLSSCHRKQTEKLKNGKELRPIQRIKENISIEVRRHSNDLCYLSMNDLAYLVDMKNKGKPNSSANLSRDADEV